MRKMTLDVDALRVESFDVGGADGRGTVRGNVDDDTIGGYTCVQVGQSCGAFCVNYNDSQDNHNPCGSWVDTQFTRCNQNTCGYLSCYNNATVCYGATQPGATASPYAGCETVTCYACH